MDGKIENIPLAFTPKKATEMRKSTSSSSLRRVWFMLCQKSCACAGAGIGHGIGFACVCVCAMGSAQHTAQITSMEISLECSSLGFV